MEGTIFDIKRFAIHDGPGIRTTVFMKGCPLDCWWCHNPESKSPHIEKYRANEKLGDETVVSEKTVGYKISVTKLMDQLVKERVFMEEGKGGVTFSGGEPLMQLEFLLESLKACKLNELHTALDTTGLVNKQLFESVLPFVDLLLFDLKCASSDLHKKYTGVSNELIIKNLQTATQKGNRIIVRIPVIPGVNMNITEMEALLKLLKPLKSNHLNEVHFLPFHNIGKDKYTKFNQINRMKNTPEPGIEDMKPYIDSFNEAGFKVLVHGYQHKTTE